MGDPGASYSCPLVASLTSEEDREKQDLLRHSIYGLLIKRLGYPCLLSRVVDHS
jgi:hypothetical protein